MEKEKLNSYLSKVVAFMQPVGAQVKGFLYHDTEGYYIKTIEILRGGNSVGDIIRLKSEDIEHLSHASKPSLMIVDMKSWHYKLMKYVLGDSCPTPKTMQNGCPYFWLLLFSLVAVPFVVIGSAIKSMLKGITEFTDSYIQRNVDAWLKSFETDEELYDVYESKSSRPFLVNKYYKNSSSNTILIEYIEKKYGVDYYKNAKEFSKIRKELNEKYEKYSNEKIQKNYKKQNEYHAKNAAKRERELKRQEKIEKFFAPVAKLIFNILDGISNVFTELKKQKNIIRVTKNFFGIIITLVLLVISYGFSSFLIYLIIGLIDLIVLYWTGVLIGLGCICCAGLLTLLIYLMGKWIHNIVAEYKRGRKIWYAELLINLFYKPIKFLGNGIKNIVLYVIVKPIVFIFYTVIYQFLLVNCFKFFVGTIVASTGILGEYMGASFTDFCPGLGWVNDPENENIKE